MDRNMIILIALQFLFAFSSCGDNGNVPEPKPPVPPITQDIQGSFESKYKRYSQGEKHAGQTVASKIVTQWRDTVWRNERLHTQIVLWANEAKEGISYQVSDLKNGSQAIPASSVRLRFPSYVIGDVRALDCGAHTTRQSAYIADALPEASVNRITTSDPVKVWVTIDVPKEAATGLYEGNIVVKQHGEEKLSFELKILVTNNTLPDVKDWSFHLDIWQFPFQLLTLCENNGVRITPFSSEYESLMTSFYKMLADAGQTAVTTYIKDGAFREGQTMVDWRLNADNTWSFDYAKFDKFVEFMFSLGINKQINCFSPVGWNASVGYYDAATSRYKTLNLQTGSDEYNEIWTAFLTSFRTHLTSKGWFDKAVIYLDEARDDEVRKVVNLIRQNGTDWKIGLAGSRISADIENVLYDYSTVLTYERASTNTVSTFYTSCSQTIPNNYVSRETSSAEMVWMSWHAASKGYKGYLRWAFDYWLNSDPFNIQDGGNTAGDFNMIYRTNNTTSSKAVASIRFELLREGIQDYEKIKRLSNSELNSYLSRMDKNSGTNAKRLMEEGQRLIKRVSAAR